LASHQISSHRFTLAVPTAVPHVASEKVPPLGLVPHLALENNNR
jgi:hypothetical protein